MSDSGVFVYVFVSPTKVASLHLALLSTVITLVVVSSVA